MKNTQVKVKAKWIESAMNAGDIIFVAGEYILARICKLGVNWGIVEICGRPFYHVKNCVPSKKLDDVKCFIESKLGV